MRPKKEKRNGYENNFSTSRKKGKEKEKVCKDEKKRLLKMII